MQISPARQIALNQIGDDKMATGSGEMRNRRDSFIEMRTLGIISFDPSDLAKRDLRAEMPFVFCTQIRLFFTNLSIRREKVNRLQAQKKVKDSFRTNTH